MEEIRRENHLGCIPNLVNNGIFSPCFPSTGDFNTPEILNQPSTTVWNDGSVMFRCGNETAPWGGKMKADVETVSLFRISPREMIQFDIDTYFYKTWVLF